ncbi:MAG: SAF domain-containing protein [Anaerolineales bacterium]|nr:SAF domain-containing protein [Anaerolineales bacterium]
MNSRVRTGLLIAIGGFSLIALGIFLSIRFLNVDLSLGVGKATPTPAAETKILVAFAANDVSMGTVITAKDVTLAEIPIQFATRDAVTNLDNVVGKITKADIVKGEMILDHNLANPTGAAYDIAYVLDDKHVLMALPATDLMSREAIVKRGDIVDIMVSIQEKLNPADDTQPKAGPQQVTFTASQRLNISAIVIDVVKNDNANAADNPTPNRNQVVVQAYLIALNPQDALVLKFLKDAGGIFEFVIRAPTSTGQFELTPVTSEFIKELYGLEILP